MSPSGNFLFPIGKNVDLIKLMLADFSLIKLVWSHPNYDIVET